METQTNVLSRERADGRDHEVDPVRMQGRFFKVRPVRPSDVDPLYDIATDAEVSYRWRYRGQLPTREQFEADLTLGIMSKLTVSSDEVVGLLLAYFHEPRNGHAFIGAIFAPRYIAKGITIDAVLLFRDYLFATWPLRKLYMETPEFNLPLFASGVGELFEVEGRLRGHEYFQGRYWDKLILATYRPTPVADDAAGPGAP